jgi:hypothetical protein
MCISLLETNELATILRDPGLMTKYAVTERQDRDNVTTTGTVVSNKPVVATGEGR